MIMMEIKEWNVVMMTNHIDIVVIVVVVVVDDGDASAAPTCCDDGLKATRDAIHRAIEKLKITTSNQSTVSSFAFC